MALALFVHLTILWLAFFAICAPPPRSPIIRRAKQLAAVTFAVICIEGLMERGAV